VPEACPRALRQVLPLALLAGVCSCTPDRSRLTSIGGPWYFHLRAHLPEAGWVPVDLYRDWKGKPVLVASNLEEHKFYEPDCVVYVTGHASPSFVYYAACGDRRPVAIDVHEYRFWEMEADGLRNRKEVRIIDGKPARWTKWIPLEEIRVVSARQPPFAPRWWPVHTSVVRPLRPIEVEEPIDDRSEGGAYRSTPLIDAVAGTGPTPAQRLALVDALIEHGGNVNITDAHGFSVLMMAASRGEPDLVRRLLRAGAVVDLQAADGRTALMLAAESRGERTETVRLLLQAGADRMLRDRNGRTAADRMRSSRDPELLALLQ